MALLAECLNHDITPVVPSKGTVGASGDLTPPAHLALALTGHGEAMLDGERLPAAVALARADLAPLMLGRKEGLALVNGTSAMAGIAALSAVDMARLVDLSLLIGLRHAEVSGARHVPRIRALGERGRIRARRRCMPPSIACLPLRRALPRRERCRR